METDKSDFKRRLLDEFNDITIKIGRLECFLDDFEPDLDKEDLELLKRQLSAMSMYHDVLHERIYLIMK